METEMETENSGTAMEQSARFAVAEDTLKMTVGRSTHTRSRIRSRISTRPQTMTKKVEEILTQSKSHKSSHS
jgi:hypothetical protein